VPVFLAFPILRTSQFQHAFPVPILIARETCQGNLVPMRGYTRPFTAVSMTYGTGVNTVCTYQYILISRLRMLPINFELVVL